MRKDKAICFMADQLSSPVTLEANSLQIWPAGRSRRIFSKCRFPQKFSARFIAQYDIDYDHVEHYGNADIGRLYSALRDKTVVRVPVPAIKEIQGERRGRIGRSVVLNISIQRSFPPPVRITSDPATAKEEMSTLNSPRIASPTNKTEKSEQLI